MVTKLIISRVGRLPVSMSSSYKLWMSNAESNRTPLPSPADEKGWEELSKNILRAEMMKNGVSYATLAERLAEFDITDNELNLRNKVSRGRFTAVFLMQCLTALKADWIKVPALDEGSRKGGAQALAKGPSLPGG